MSNILLTYGWVRSSYAVLRNLAAHNIPVYVSDSHHRGMGQSSKLKKKFELYPSHYRNEELFIQRIGEICDKNSIDLIFPSHNETEILARHRDVFSARLTALLPKAEHCFLFNNKSLAYDYAQSLEIPVPLRIDYDNTNQLAQKIGDLGLKKTVVKLRTGNSAKGVFYAETPSESQRIVSHLIEKYDLLGDRYPQVEEYVSGEGWGNSVLYWHGHRVASFTHRRLREKISTGGTSTLRESAQNPLVEAAAKRIFDAIGWHGLAMCEFKVCSQTGKFWFIEVNPRLWGSLPLAVSAGVEFPYLAWLCATEGPQAAMDYHSKSSVRYPWKSRWLLGDITVAARELLSGKLLHSAEIILGAKADYSDDFFWDDPSVFLGELAFYLKNSLLNLSLNPSEKGMIG